MGGSPHETIFERDGVTVSKSPWGPADFRSSARTLPMPGARALFFPMAWEQQRSFVFEGVVAARAIENVAYIVCINQTGTRGMTKFHGGSKIIDPLGHTLTDMGAAAGISTADLDLDWVTRLRSAVDTATYPLLTDRRQQMPVRRGPGPICRH
jgi:predicted amidohydrolase